MRDSSIFLRPSYTWSCLMIFASLSRSASNCAIRLLTLFNSVLMLVYHQNPPTPEPITIMIRNSGSARDGTGALTFPLFLFGAPDKLTRIIDQILSKRGPPQLPAMVQARLLLP